MAGASGSSRGPAAAPAPPTGPFPPIRPWSAFAFRDYTVLWTSSVAAMVTQQMRLLVTFFWLYEETGSGAALGFAGLIQLVVMIPAILYGGMLADKVDRKKLMAQMQGVSLVTASALAGLIVAGALAPWHIYAATAILSVSGVLGNPARAALTANVVPRSHLMHAVTINTATMQIGSVVAPLVFGGTALFIGLPAAFILTAVFAIPSVFLPLMIRAEGVPAGQEAGRSMIRNIWEGFLFVKAHRILPGLYFMDIGVTVVSFYRQILPVLADRLFRSGAGGVAVLTAANSVGGVIGSFLVLFLARIPRKGMIVVYATLAYGVLLILFGLSTSLIIGTVIIIGLGVTDAVGMTTRQTIVQLTSPDNMRGRAVSFHSLSAMTANNIGHWEVGFMSDQIGAGNTMLLGGIVSILVVLLIWTRFRGVREYRG